MLDAHLSPRNWIHNQDLPFNEVHVLLEALEACI